MHKINVGWLVFNGYIWDHLTHKINVSNQNDLGVKVFKFLVNCTRLETL